MKLASVQDLTFILATAAALEWGLIGSLSSPAIVMGLGTEFFKKVVLNEYSRSL